MGKLFLKLAFLFVSFLLIFSPLTAEAKNDGHLQEAHSNHSADILKSDLRKLWIDHVLWTRSYITSALAGIGDKDKVLVRLLKNQQDIGDAIKPYYGEKAGNQLAELLREHILLAGKVVEAAKSGNQSNLKKYNEEWYKNADEIAHFLSSANPNWSNKVLKDMLHTHLQFITDQAVARIKKNWDADITAFDRGEDHMIKFADVLTEGVIKQFPNKF
jgi:hypothetical protein